MSLVHLPDGLIFRIEDFMADYDSIEEFRDIQEAFRFYSDGIALLREVLDTIRQENAPANGVVPPSGNLPPSFGADAMNLLSVGLGYRKPRREFPPMLPPERSNTAILPRMGG